VRPLKADRILTRKETVGRCPACSETIEAVVTIAVKVSEPVLDDAGKATVETTTAITGVRVKHSCDGEPTTVGDEGEPENPDDVTLDPPAEA
jgi:hypothetical protein